MRFILGAVKRNPLFLHEIEWKNNRFLFTTPNIKIQMHCNERCTLQLKRWKRIRHGSCRHEFLKIYMVYL